MTIPSFKNTLLPAMLLALLAGLMAPLAARAQTLDEARAMIRNKQYEQAATAFSKLMKQYGSRADVNKWYGEALFMTGRYTEAEKYLTIAAKRKITGAYPLLGELCLLDYRFADAVSWYEKYLPSVKKDAAETARIEALIEQAESCEKGLSRVENVVVIDSIVVDKARFFEYYRLGQESGRLIDYKLLADATGHSEGDAAFESQRGDRRVFGRQSASGGYDLYEQSKLLGDKWSEPTPFPDNINTAANENFPFVLTDGATLYYASDSEDSYGGYDLYVTKYNVSTGSYFAPEHLPMPFNSPYNDYMMAIDEGNQVGWFASDRFQPEGKVIIYLFLPNFGERAYCRDLSVAELRSRARIASIKATWPADANYEKLLYGIFNEEEDFSAQKGAFFFVINDKIIYYNLDDFESSQARSMYERAAQQRGLYDADSAELADLRRQWAEGDAAVQRKIRARILTLEGKLPDMLSQIEQLEQTARNTEITYLRSHKR